LTTATKPKPSPTNEPTPDQATSPLGERPLHYTRRGPFRYAGRMYGRNEIIRVGGHRNDDTLLTRGYIAELPADETPVQCGQCSRWFKDDRSRSLHGADEHKPRPADWSPADEDKALDRTMRQVNQEAPVLGLDTANA
jgi:hypothetical protein